MAVDRELRLLLDFLAESGEPSMSQGTPAQARHSFRTLAVDLRDPAFVPEVGSVEAMRVAGGDGELDARVYRPDLAGPLPTTVLLHGGGWVIGDLDTHDVLARELANGARAVVVSVDYRLAPEHPFPAAVEDAVAATRWVGEHLPQLGGDSRLGVGGDSAGGNLAAVVAQTFRDESRPLAGQLLIYPSTDLGSQLPSRTENGQGYFLDTDTMVWFAAHYLGDATDLTDRRLSPLHGRHEGTPPAVVVVAAFDPLRDEGLAYAEALAAAGVPTQVRVFDGLVHGFMDMGRYSARAQAAVAETCALFGDVLRA